MVKFRHFYTLGILTGLSLVSSLLGAAAPQIRLHVIPVSFDERPNYKGWKAIVDDSGKDIQGYVRLVPGKSERNLAWAILRGVGLDRPGNWHQFKIDTADRAGKPNVFVFYQIDFSNFGQMPQGCEWVRISRDLQDSMAGQQIDGYTQWALRKFLEHEGTASQSSAPSPAVARPSAQRRQAAQGQYNPMPSPIQGWYAISGSIWFDRPTEPYFEFTNFYEQPVDIQNIYTGNIETWPAVECYFHAMKTDDPAVQARLRQMAPTQALTSRPNPPQGWDESLRFFVMRTALDAKFAPGTRLAAKLLDTKGRVLVEKTCGRRSKEAVWGADDGFGQNHLGRMLMVVRDSLRDGKQYDYDPATTYTLGKVERAISNGRPLDIAR